VACSSAGLADDLLNFRRARHSFETKAISFSVRALIRLPFFGIGYEYSFFRCALRNSALLNSAKYFSTSETNPPCFIFCRKRLCHSSTALSEELSFPARHFLIES
jgi:hypothetical protein